MNETLGRMGVQITVDNKQAVKGFSDTQNAAKATADAIKRAKSQIAKNSWSKESRQAMAPYEMALKEAQANVRNAIATSVKADRATQNAAKATQLSVEKLNKAADATKSAKAKLEAMRKAWSDLRVAGKDVVPTYPYKQLELAIESADDKLRALKKSYIETRAEWDKVAHNPPKTRTAEYNGILARMAEIRNTDTWRFQKNIGNNTEMQSLYKEMVALKAREKELLANGGAYEPNWNAIKQAQARFQEVAEQLRQAKLEADGLRQQMAEMEASGKAFTYTAEAEKMREAYAKLKGEIATLEEVQSEALYRYAQAYNEEIDAKHRGVMATDEQIEAEKRLEAAIEERNRAERMVAGAEYSRRRSEMLAEYAKKWALIGKQVRNYANRVKGAVVGTVAGLKKMAHGFGKIYQRIPLLNSIPKTLKKIRRGLYMGMGVRGLIRLGVAGFGVYKALSMMREGMTNLAQYSAQTNSDISMLKSSLATLKNALATSFAPIFTAIAPAINYLLELLIKAATAIAHFTAAFTGKSTVVVAKKQTVDYAGSLNDAAGAADSANEAAQEYQKTLLGFDQMEILNDASNGSGSGSGGGAGGAGVGVGDMFETVEVSDKAGDLAQKIKDAWAKADFTDIGEAIGNKLSQGLAAIPWEKIKSVAEKAGSSLATLINGFIGSGYGGKNLGTLIGETLANALNTAFTFLSKFVTTLHWSDIGKFIANAINGFFSTTSWSKIASTLSTTIIGLTDTISTALSEIDWEAIGHDLAKFIEGIDWITIARKILGIIWQAFKGLSAVALTLFDDWLKDLFNKAGLEYKGLPYQNGNRYTTYDQYNGTQGSVNSAVRLSGGATIGKTGVPVNMNGLEQATKANTKETKKTNAIWGSLSKQWNATPRQLSVIDAFKAPNTGSLFGSLGGLSAQAKIKTTAELVGIKDKIPTGKKSVGNMLAMLSRKNETFSHTSNNMTASLGSKLEDFVHTSNNMTASLGSKSEGFDHWTNQMSAWITGKSEGFDHWTNKMSAWITGKSEGFSHWTNEMSAWLKYKGEYFSHWTDGMTAWITSVSFASRAKQILLSALAEGGVYRNGRWAPVTAAAGGGSFTTGQMFIAREAGPELVGRIGSGTSVMNNDQIVASVSAGVAQGAYQAFVSAFSDTGGLQTNVVLQGDAAKFFRAMQQQAIMYMNSTGQSPFPM